MAGMLVLSAYESLPTATDSAPERILRAEISFADGLHTTDVTHLADALADWHPSPGNIDVFQVHFDASDQDQPQVLSFVASLLRMEGVGAWLSRVRVQLLFPSMSDAVAADTFQRISRQEFS